MDIEEGGGDKVNKFSSEEALFFLPNWENEPDRGGEALLP